MAFLSSSSRALGLIFAAATLDEISSFEGTVSKRKDSPYRPLARLA
jgi:hypothetical protein